MQWTGDRLCLATRTCATGVGGGAAEVRKRAEQPSSNAERDMMTLPLLAWVSLHAPAIVAKAG